MILVEGSGGGVVGDVDVGPAVIVEVGDGDGECVGADGVPHAAFLRDVGEGAVAVVAVEDVFATLQTGGAAGYLNAFVGAAGGFGKGGGLDVEVDVVGDEEVEVAVAVVVEERAAGVPSGLRLQEACFGGDIGEGAVAVIAIEDILSVVADEEIVPAIVVVVADAATLSPAAAAKAGFGCDVGEGAVAIVFEEVRDGLLTFGEAFDAGAVDEEDVEPVVMVVVKEGHAAACGFEEVSVLVLATVDRLGVEAGLASHVNEADAERRSGDRVRAHLWARGGAWRRRLGGSLSAEQVVVLAERPAQERRRGRAQAPCARGRKGKCDETRSNGCSP